jgi:hypothetical protein
MRGIMGSNCQLIKETLLEFLGAAIDVTEMRDYCILTLPQKTLDDRLASVFVQEKMPGYFLVNDGGKTSAELFAQGIHITDVRLTALEELAERYGATFVQGTFRMGCHADKLNAAIVAIGQCATLATWYVLGHKPRFNEEPVLHRIEAGMRAWRPPYENEIRPRVRVLGQKMEHVIDFVSFPRDGTIDRPDDRKFEKVLQTLNPQLPIGVKVVRPSDNPLEQARGYGFMAYDLAGTPFDSWPRVAVVTRKEDWTEPAMELVYKSASIVIPIETGEEDKLEKLIPERLSEVAA